MSKFEGPKSSIDRIVVTKGHWDERETGGLTDEKEQEVRAAVHANFGELFAGQQMEELQDFLREPTAEELKIFEMANHATNRVLERFGLGEFNLPPANVHIVTGAKWLEFKSKFGISDGTEAFYCPDLQAIFCKEDPARLVMLEHSIHEMVHAKAFQSQNAVYYEATDEVATEMQRSGLGLRALDGKLRFNLLDEAVTVELQKLAAEETREDALFSGETSILNEFLTMHPEVAPKEPFAVHLIPVKDGEAEEFQVQLTLRPYSGPRAVLRKIVDALYEHNPGDFQNREEVLALFINGALTGALLPLGRLIEKTYGPGTFRELSECQTEEQLEEFAKSLKI